MSKLQKLVMGRPLVKKAEEEEELSPGQLRANLGHAIRRGTETRMAMKNPLTYLAARSFLGPDASVIKMAAMIPDTLEEFGELCKEARKGPGWDHGGGGGSAYAMTPGALGLSEGQSRMLGGPDTFSSLAAATMRPGMYGGMYGGGGGLNPMGPASVDNVISLYKGQASGQGGYGVGW